MMDNTLPVVIIQLDDPPTYYVPGSTLSGSYRITNVEPEEIKQVEFSVLWFTEGKGDEDMGVAYFSQLIGTSGMKRVHEDISEEAAGGSDMEVVNMGRRRSYLHTEHSSVKPSMLDISGSFPFNVMLPYSPLSYYGKILKIHWSVRVRIFLKNGRDVMHQKIFRVGNVPVVEIQLG